MANARPAQWFQRMDESNDALFYQHPRKVVHIDAGAIVAASALYGELLPPDGEILDLMAAWRTHIPSTYHARKVTGLGMNADEMADNPQLQTFVVQDLNVAPHLPFEAESFDAAICTVSVQYLTQPVAVFTDLFRVLRPSGVAIFTFSNRCFPTKAVAVWHSSSMADRAAIVSGYLHDAGFVEVRSADRSPTAKFSLFGNAGDPLVGVWGYKPTVRG